MRDTLEIGVYEAVATYNKGNMARVEILEQLGITPGQQCVATMKKFDEIRVLKAEKAAQEIEKRCRKQLSIARKRLEDHYDELEDPDNPAYEAGMY